MGKLSDYKRPAGNVKLVEGGTYSWAQVPGSSGAVDSHSGGALDLGLTETNIGGQTFTASTSDPITGVGFELETVNAPTGNTSYIIGIYNYAGVPANAADGSAGNELIAVTGEINFTDGYVAGVKELREIPLITQANVVAGTKYFMQLTFIHVAGPHSTNVTFDGVDNYADGEALINPGLTGYVLGSGSGLQDFNFATFSTVAAINNLTLSADAFIQKPNKALSDNKILAQAIDIPAGEVAYVVADNSGTLVVSTSLPSAAPLNSFIIGSHDSSGDVVIGDTMKLSNGDSKTIYEDLQGSGGGSSVSQKLIEGGNIDWNISGIIQSDASSLVYTNPTQDGTFNGGQTFTPTKNIDVSTLALVLDQGPGGSTGNFFYEIYATSGGLPTGAPLGTSQVQDSATLPLLGAQALQPLTFLTPVSLIAGVKYALVLSGTVTVVISVSGSSTDTYSEGNLVTNLFGSWTADPSQDMAFEINAGGENQLTFSSPAQLQIPGLANSVNNILAQSVAIPSGEVAYVSPNLSAPGGNLTINVGSPSAAAGSDYIIARRMINEDLLIGDTMRLKLGEAGTIYEQVNGYLEKLSNPVNNNYEAYPGAINLYPVLVSQLVQPGIYDMDVIVVFFASGAITTSTLGAGLNVPSINERIESYNWTSVTPNVVSGNPTPLFLTVRNVVVRTPTTFNINARAQNSVTNLLFRAKLAIRKVGNV